MDRMAIVFILCVAGMYVISLIENRGPEAPRSGDRFENVPHVYRIRRGSLIIIGLLIALYAALLVTEVNPDK